MIGERETILLFDLGGPDLVPGLGDDSGDRLHRFVRPYAAPQRLLASHDTRARELHLFHWTRPGAKAARATVLFQDQAVQEAAQLAGDAGRSNLVVLSVADWDAALRFLYVHGPLGTAEAVVICSNAPVDSAPCESLADLLGGATATLLDRDGRWSMISGSTPLPSQPVPSPYPAPAGLVDLGELGGIDPRAEDEGISLVTCAMNRTGNLLRALQTWLNCPEISEIVLVDWSSVVPVGDSLREAGISDPRIRLVRVEGERRWVLSYAFNVGFRLARHDRILKADADILLKPDFFARNPLGPDSFIAGNWRKASKDQAHVNGFFFLHRKDLAAIGGFNEHITTYGWDDDDLYSRLEANGTRRTDVDIDTIHHQDHLDAERVGTGGLNLEQATDAFSEITGNTLYLIRRNRFLTNVMPVWDDRKTPLPLLQFRAPDGTLVLRRQGWLPHEVPPRIEADADHYALLEMASWRLGPPTLGLGKAALRRLLERPFAALGRLDVLIARLAQEDYRPPARGYVVVTLRTDPPAAGNRTALALARLVRLATGQGRQVVLRGPAPAMPGLDAIAPGCLYLPEWENIGTLPDTEVAALLSDSGPGEGHVAVMLDDLAAKLLAGMPAAPAVAPARRARLFIDAQHGLGNRMRAIGSAAAIAAATGREMVIVWQPDHHCEGRFEDLFDYDGPVEDEAFVDEAADRGCAVYNYMEIEEGSQKDAPIDLDRDGDIYARAAYVLNAPPSTWEAENRFLQGLTPVEQVRDLVASVRTPNDVSAHVRMVGGAEYEHLAYEALDNWTEEGHALTDFWRRKSHFKHFIERIDRLAAEGGAGRIFLAADKPETYEAFLQTFGERVAYLPRELYDRSAEQLRYALADALLLGSAPLLLGSTWSSFSELAMRLSPKKMTIEMSGKDF